jgi:hypothetical protein
VIATALGKADGTMRECAELGIKQVWMHRSYGQGSVSGTATTYGREHSIATIDGGCQRCSSRPPISGPKIMRVIYRGQVPKTVGRGRDTPGTAHRARCLH